MVGRRVNVLLTNKIFDVLCRFVNAKPFKSVCIPCEWPSFNPFVYHPSVFEACRLVPHLLPPRRTRPPSALAPRSWLTHSRRWRRSRPSWRSGRRACRARPSGSRRARAPTTSNSPSSMSVSVRSIRASSCSRRYDNGKDGKDKVFIARGALLRDGEEDGEAEGSPQGEYGGKYRKYWNLRRSTRASRPRRPRR